MKVALCLSGIVGGCESRSGGGSYGNTIHPKLGYSFWKKSLLDHYDVDVFIHSWSVEQQNLLNDLYRPQLCKYEKQKIWIPPSGD